MAAAAFDSPELAGVIVTNSGLDRGHVTRKHHVTISILILKHWM